MVCIQHGKPDPEQFMVVLGAVNVLQASYNIDVAISNPCSTGCVHMVVGNFEKGRGLYCMTRTAYSNQCSSTVESCMLGFVGFEMSDKSRQLFLNFQISLPVKNAASPRTAAERMDTAMMDGQMAYTQAPQRHLRINGVCTVYTVAILD